MPVPSSSFSREALNDLSDYFHAAPIGLHLTTADGTITMTNLAELELLGYGGRAAEFVGRHVAELHADAESAQPLMDRVRAGERVAEYATTLVRRDGSTQRVLLYANAKMKDGRFNGIRTCTFPHPDDLRPEIADIGAQKDQSLESRHQQLSVEEEIGLYQELQDFFENSPVNLHIVGGDGLIKYASRSEIASMGYDQESYLGAHIARFHADQAVIDGMLTDLVGGAPLVNFNATLFHKDGSKLPVMIYSNSRMRDGSFVNTRCFTVPLPSVSERSAASLATRFLWPRNEDLGFTVAARDQPSETPDPMTLALRYIAARKRPEESLGFLARVSQVLAQARPLTAMLDEVMTLCVPFLADFASVDSATGHLAHSCGPALNRRSEGILRQVQAAHAPVPVAGAQYSGDSAEDSMGNLDVRQRVVLPLAVRGRTTGTLTLLRANLASRPDFGPADHALAEELARRLTFALEIEELSGHT